LTWLCKSNQIDSINAYIRGRGGAGPVTIFFRGQCLELMRWAARYCRNLPCDGQSFDDPQRRENFFKALRKLCDMSLATFARWIVGFVVLLSLAG